MINLLPFSIRTERLYGRRNRILIGFVVSLFITAGLVACIMIGGLGFVASEEDTIRAELEKNNEQVLMLESEIKDVSSIAARLAAADKLFDSSILFSELVPEIGSLLPKGSIINSLALTGGNTDPLTLDVSLASAGLAAVLQSNLVQSELFEAADVNSISPLGSSDTIYTFNASVSVSFTGSAEAKRIIASQAAAARALAEEQKQVGTQ
jgi:hypothetical protein